MAEPAVKVKEPTMQPHRNAREIISSQEFRSLVAKRWTVSLVLLAALFATYYGYIVLIATNKELVSRKIGEVTTLAIPLGIAVILVAWLLTALYVTWANRSYDPEVDRIKGRLQR